MDLHRYTSAGNFLIKSDVPTPRVLTIASTSEHCFEGKSPQLVLIWQESDVRPMVCNTTNARLLATLFNVTDDSQLIGRKVEVYVDHAVQMRGQVVGGLRLRLPQSQPAYQQPPAAQQAQQQQQPPVTQQSQQPRPFPETPW